MTACRARSLQWHSFLPVGCADRILVGLDKSMPRTVDQRAGLKSFFGSAAACLNATQTPSAIAGGAFPDEKTITPLACPPWKDRRACNGGTLLSALVCFGATIAGWSQLRSSGRSGAAQHEDAGRRVQSLRMNLSRSWQRPGGCPGPTCNPTWRPFEVSAWPSMSWAQWTR